MSDLHEERIRSDERRKIVAGLALYNSLSVMPYEWHEGLDAALAFAADPEAPARMTSAEASYRRATQATGGDE